MIVDTSELLKHKRKVKLFGISPEEESWDFAVTEEAINSMNPRPAVDKIFDAIAEIGENLNLSTGKFEIDYKKFHELWRYFRGGDCKR